MPNKTLPDSQLPLIKARAQYLARAEAQFAIIKTLVKIISIGVVMALALRSFVYEPFNIPSSSMKPNLLVGDYLVISKWRYGYSRFALPLAPALFTGTLWAKLPERGDIVVFKSPADNRTDYIKRVIGLPGDRIRVTHGQVEINGQILQRTPDTSVKACTYSPVKLCKSVIFRETLANGRSYLIEDRRTQKDSPMIVVPAGRLYLLGDHRDDSADSRMTIAQGGIGLVLTSNLMGRAEVIYFSTDGSASVTQPQNWLASVRFRRIGQRL